VLAALGPGSDSPLPVISPADALAHLPRCEVDPASAKTLEQGKRLAWTSLGSAPDPADGPRVRVVRADGSLLAVAEPRPDGTVRTLRVFGVGDPGSNVQGMR